MWAYAKLGALAAPKPAADESSGLERRGKGDVGSLLDALAVEAVSQLMDGRCRTKFIPQNLANMVYGCVLHASCFHALCQADPLYFVTMTSCSESHPSLSVAPDQCTSTVTASLAIVSDPASGSSLAPGWVRRADLGPLL